MSSVFDTCALVALMAVLIQISVGIEPGSRETGEFYHSCCFMGCLLRNKSWFKVKTGSTFRERT